MYRYEQHCPIARAAEVLTEPWTLLVVRELARGHETRADIAEGVPGMSANLLTRRLRTLVANGLVATSGDDEVRYRLTEAGQGLRPVVDQLGRWGQRWLAPPGLADLDATVLLRDICVQMAPDRLPTRTLSVEVVITDAPGSGRWWLALSPEGAVIGDAPAEPPDVRLLCTLSGLAGAWLGQQSWLAAVRARSVVLVGSAAAARDLLACVGVNRYVDQRVPA